MKKILVVDDDESIANALMLVLEEEGYEVKAIVKGDETHSQAKKFKPNLILLDLLLSGKDGSEICKKIKTDKETSNIPIIIISAHPNAKKTALDSGANDFLPKPFDTNVLLDTISKRIT